MTKSRRQRIWERAGGCCEYRRIPQNCDVLPFQIDHIRAQKHSGATTFENLALACLPCNSAKGPNIAGYDPESDALNPLFNPRQDAWEDHFVWSGPKLEGKTSIGRTTIAVLAINSTHRVEHRRLLIQVQVFLP